MGWTEKIKPIALDVPFEISTEVTNFQNMFNNCVLSEEMAEIITKCMLETSQVHRHVESMSSDLVQQNGEENGK